MKSTKPFMESCFLCKSEFQMGGGEFHGYFMKPYGVTVCRGCFRAAKDGWPAASEEKLLPKLKELGKPVPERNDRGLLPRDA